MLQGGLARGSDGMLVPQAIVVYLPHSATIIQGVGEDRTSTNRPDYLQKDFGPELPAVTPEDTQGHVSWTDISPANRLVAIEFGIA